MAAPRAPERTTRSPDGLHVLEFRYAGEIRFGPAFYTVDLDGRPLRRLFRRRFGDAAGVWSPDSRYAALQEWFGVSESAGPTTALRVVDVVERRQCGVARLAGAFVTPTAIDGGRLTFRVTRYGQHRIAAEDDRVIDLGEVSSWTRLR